jgi:hypothetical protein
LGTGTTFCNALLDGTEGLAISDTDGVTGTIVYHNSFAGCSVGETESPVLNVTAAQDNPDRSLVGAIEAISANPFDSVSPNSAVLIGDDGGFNGLVLGESDDADYFMQADVYCYDRASTPAFYETTSIFVRGARDNDPNDNGGAFSMDRGGSYALVWDAHLGIVSARKWEVNATQAAIYDRVAGSFTEFAQMALTGNAWHTFRIDADGSQITFEVDGTQLAQVTDTAYTNGRCGMVYREGGGATAITPNEDETQGYFDNLIAGPIPPPTPPLGFFLFDSEIDTSSVGGPVGIDVDASGGLYFVTFADATSALNYIADPAGAPGTITTVDTVVFPAARGLQDVEVNAAGEVFICGDDGGTTTMLRKYGVAPAFTPDATFNANTAASARRHSGLTIVTGDAGSPELIMAGFTTTGDIHFYSAADGTDVGGAVAAAASTFQRDPSFNPNNGDIYQSHNGSGTDVIAVISGGDAGNPAGYTQVLPGLIASAGSPPNTAGLGSDFFHPTDALVVRDSGSVPPSVTIYDISGSGAGTTATLNQVINTAAAPGGDITNPGDQVISDESPRVLYISDFGTQRILVYIESPVSGVDQFELFD